ncbi:hypothetical protein ACNTMW_15470 [Planosporangium sp. 12N6]|uniref:hypothetical protein n=1 Tax=Planosporangium spinosum TaxID=3402278 RepID=UPI003CEB6620
MDQRTDIEQTLREHYRRALRRWRCRCGRLWPCTAWQLAAEQRFDLNCRARLNDVIAQMGNDSAPPVMKDNR